MFGAALRSSRIIFMLPVSSGLSEKIRHTRPPVIGGRSLPKRAVNASTAWFGGAILAGGAAGGTAATAGGAVSGGGRLGTDGPVDGARFIAGPDGGSGTEAGGTGGGRSPNNCAATGLAMADPKSNTNTGIRRERPPRQNLPASCRPRFIMDAFHRKRGKFKPALVGPGRYGTGVNLFRYPFGFAAVSSQSHRFPRHKPCSSAILAAAAVSR